MMGTISNLASGGGRLSFDINDNHQLLTGLEAVNKNTVGLMDMESLDRERDADYSRLNYFLEYNVHPTQLTSLMLRANHSEQENEIDITPATSMIAGVEKRGSPL